MPTGHLLLIVRVPSGPKIKGRPKPPFYFWCGRRDLNPYSVKNTPLKRARMPIPPRPHGAFSAANRIISQRNPFVKPFQRNKLLLFMQGHIFSDQCDLFMVLLSPLMYPVSVFFGGQIHLQILREVQKPETDIFLFSHFNFIHCDSGKGCQVFNTGIGIRNTVFFKCMLVYICQYISFCF